MNDNESSIPKSRLSSAHKYILLTACNTPAPFDCLAGQSSGTIKVMKEFFGISGMKYGGKAVFAGTRNKSELPINVVSKIKKLIK